jgi:hypothetical protein
MRTTSKLLPFTCRRVESALSFPRQVGALELKVTPKLEANVTPTPKRVQWWWPFG